MIGEPLRPLRTGDFARCVAIAQYGVATTVGLARGVTTRGGERAGGKGRTREVEIVVVGCGLESKEQTFLEGKYSGRTKLLTVSLYLLSPFFLR